MEILSKILEARDNRAALREQISKKGNISVSLSLNIAGYPKSDTITEAFFITIINEFERTLLANLITINKSECTIITDADGNFYIAPVSSNTDSKIVKQVCEKFEETHKAGRIIDADVTTSANKSESSGKAKHCIVCKTNAAVDCMRNRNHSIEEVREAAWLLMTDHIKTDKEQKLTNSISSFALKSIIYEISLTPKPGLVDFNDDGIHTDMNYYTFVNSTSIIIPYLNRLALLGTKHIDTSHTDILTEIREIGIEAEKDMFIETSGVNTQKGVIFLLGLAVYASSHIINRYGYFDIRMVSELISSICCDMVKTEMTNNTDSQTHGQKCYNKYGNKFGGARAEAESGLKTAIDYGYSILDNSGFNILKSSNRSEMNKLFTSTLLNIMANNNDSNILYRSDIKTLEEFKTIASDTLNAINNGVNINEAMNSINSFCSKNRISAGGAADLLSVSIFLYLCKLQYSKIS
ncbi:MAG: triphosphoribosyl-dephospho-CoA synthase [Bacteroidales bacterium]|jgi:holo-ACP synthase/triphosphoribosyl-dephospho-CoA synthase|nr:triphosphoribosyl-dephospho-CoA synthase [Bacteroidales bacterium]